MQNPDKTLKNASLSLLEITWKDSFAASIQAAARQLRIIVYVVANPGYDIHGCINVGFVGACCAPHALWRRMTRIHAQDCPPCRPRRMKNQP